MIIEEVTLTAIVTAITGGFGGSAKAAAALARIRALAPRFHALLLPLRATVTATTTRLRTAQAQLERTSESLRRLIVVRIRDERGEMKPPLGWGGGGRQERLARISATIADPKLLDPQDLRKMAAEDLRRLLADWPSRPTSRGVGAVFEDPVHKGRQIRLMEGYPGNRPDTLTHGPYAVVSQNGTPTKVPLEGNGVP